MDASTRSVLDAPSQSAEYQAGAEAFYTGTKAMRNPFKPGSKSAMRWVYGFQDQFSASRRRVTK